MVLAAVLKEMASFCVRVSLEYLAKSMPNHTARGVNASVSNLEMLGLDPKHYPNWVMDLLIRVMGCFLY